MLFDTDGLASQALFAQSTDSGTPPPERRSGRADGRFAALSRTPFASRFVSWRGISGKSYVFSVYLGSDCPAFCDAIVLAVARDRAGRQRVLSVFDTGPFPEPVLARAQRELAARGPAPEFHVHLLSHTVRERQTTLADLQAAFCPARPGEI